MRSVLWDVLEASAIAVMIRKNFFRADMSAELPDMGNTHFFLIVLQRRMVMYLEMSMSVELPEDLAEVSRMQSRHRQKVVLL